MMGSIVSLTTEEVMDRGRRIYHERIRPQLTEADRGKFIEINVQTGDWVMGETDVSAGRKAKERFGSDMPVYVHRVGYQTPYAWGFSMEANREPI